MNTLSIPVLVQDLVDEVQIYSDRISVQVAGAPPIVVMTEEVGLRLASTSVMSETRRDSSATLHWRLAG
jgi:hypothetical protein